MLMKHFQSRLEEPWFENPNLNVILCNLKTQNYKFYYFTNMRKSDVIVQNFSFYNFFLSIQLHRNIYSRLKIIKSVYIAINYGKTTPGWVNDKNSSSLNKAYQSLFNT